MNNEEKDILRHDDANRQPLEPVRQPPYWTRAHRDWRIWFFVALMLTAMVIYVMTGDLSYRIHVR
jgi:hypothetical protein